MEKVLQYHLLQYEVKDSYGGIPEVLNFLIQVRVLKTFLFRTFFVYFPNEMIW